MISRGILASLREKKLSSPAPLPAPLPFRSALPRSSRQAAFTRRFGWSPLDSRPKDPLAAPSSSVVAPGDRFPRRAPRGRLLPVFPVLLPLSLAGGCFAPKFFRASFRARRKKKTRFLGFHNCGRWCPLGGRGARGRAAGKEGRGGLEAARRGRVGLVAERRLGEACGSARWGGSEATKSITKSRFTSSSPPRRPWR